MYKVGDRIQISHEELLKFRKACPATSEELPHVGPLTGVIEDVHSETYGIKFDGVKNKVCMNFDRVTLISESTPVVNMIGKRVMLKGGIDKFFSEGGANSLKFWEEVMVNMDGLEGTIRKITQKGDKYGIEFDKQILFSSEMDTTNSAFKMWFSVHKAGKMGYCFYVPIEWVELVEEAAYEFPCPEEEDDKSMSMDEDSEAIAYLQDEILSLRLESEEAKKSGIDWRARALKAESKLKELEIVPLGKTFPDSTYRAAADLKRLSDMCLKPSNSITNSCGKAIGDIVVLGVIKHEIYGFNSFGNPLYREVKPVQPNLLLLLCN